MTRISQRALAFQESAIRKLDAVVRSRPNTTFHKINIGQPDVQTPPALLDAIRAFQPKVVGYGPASGLPECREAAAKYHSAWCPSLTWKDLVVTQGGSEALLFSLAAICDPGDEIIVPEPYYTNYNGFSTMAGVSVKPIPTSIDNNFALPSDAELDAKVTEKTRAFILCNPANPTGAVYNQSEVKRLLAWTKRHNLWLISDEVYRRIWFDEEPATVLSFDEEHWICVDSLSKTYSACGARLGFLISKNEAFMEKVERLGQARLGTQPLAQHVAIAALGLPNEHYEETRAIYASRVKALVSALNEIPGVSTHAPEGAFYLMCRLPVKDTEVFARYLAAEFEHEGESVVVAPGPGFYSVPTKGRDQVRIAAVIEEDKLVRATQLLGIAIPKFNQL